jgi:N-methylhydantoinase A/oxoprolinase/acetone carboxylase beta subunit
MKTLTLELNDELEKQIELLSQQEGRDQVGVVLEVLYQGLSEKQRRQQVRKALEEVFSQPVSEPFAEMTDEEITEAVNQEISAYRKEDRSSPPKG